MTDPIQIKPFTKPVKGSVTPPGSKSITNRVLILAALSSQKIELTGALFSRDTRVMCKALTSLGFDLEVNEALKSITITGTGGNIPEKEAEIHVGNAGTAARFLTSFLCTTKGGVYKLDGDEAMRERPMSGLLDALEKQGAKFTFHGKEGYFPFTMETNGVAGGDISVDASASSQILSALLMVAPFADKSANIRLQGETVSKPFVQMTLKMLEQFSVVAEQTESTYSFSDKKPEYTSGTYAIEPDATAASYYLSLPLSVGGKILVKGLKPEMLQGDIDFYKVLKQTTAKLEWSDEGLISEFLDTAEPVKADFNPISDTFLTLAALTPLLSGPSDFTGIAHTRKQETDRIAAMATELIKLGQRVGEDEDALFVEPDYAELHARAMAGRHTGKLLKIKTYEDHRVAMSFGILGSNDLAKDGEPWLTILDPGCCGKTWPEFFEVLEGLRLESLEG